jgi:cation diffusion facilitator family transporter
VTEAKNHNPRLVQGLQASGMAIATNVVLAIAKVITGIVGNSYALIADGIESTTDVVSSLIVWGSLRIAAKPPDNKHPFGHGKAESLAGILVSVLLVAAAIFIAYQSVREILVPHHAPAWYTLVILALVVLIKGTLSSYVSRVGGEIESTALKSDAWHHRSDAITSLAAFVGISVALFGGKGFESADDWAALLACSIIVYNGIRLLKPALDEVMDAAVTEDVEQRIRHIAGGVNGVLDVEKCRIRKSGLSLLMDIHITVDGTISVNEGHRIGHIVKDRLIASKLPIEDVVVHVEPDTLLAD